ncbi:M20/M25/M40 family metallo-hydrolase [Micromonospora sp. WMMA1923]|uniref:M20/M25/M40 family metallo-hydrolase n=1 Tax=Micromonospora sp. WMMA1923 TaxID=3404125 RepID=UPI003B963A6D
MTPGAVAESEARLLRDLVDIPSVSGTEDALARHVAAHLRAAGLDARLDEVGNVIGSTGDAATGPTVMLLGHLDTVPGAPPVRLDGDVLHGRGTVDAKGPLATMVSAGIRLAGRFPGRLLVVGAVDEERASVGARHLLTGVRPDAVVIGEPNGAYGIAVGYKGVLRLRLTVRRPPAHTSSDQETAAEAVAGLWHALRSRLTDGVPAETALFDRIMPTLVGITGDLETAVADVSCRIPPDFDADEFVALVRGLTDGVGIEVTESVPAVRGTRTGPLWRAFATAVRQHGGQPVAKRKLGTSDMNVVGPVWRVPVVAYGPGDSRLCHTAQERISVAEYRLAVDVLTDALLLLAGDLADGRATGPAGDPVTGPAGDRATTGRAGVTTSTRSDDRQETPT